MAAVTFNGANHDAVEVFNASVASNGTASVDMNVSDYDTLLIAFKILSTVTPADLSTPGISAYAPDGTTNLIVFLPASSSGPASTGADVVAYVRVDVRGLGLVQARFKNANAGAKTCVMDAWVSKEAG